MPVFVGLKLSSGLRPESGAFNRHKEERAVAGILYVSRDSICSVRRTQFTPTTPHPRPFPLNRIFLFHFPPPTSRRGLHLPHVPPPPQQQEQNDAAAAGKCSDDKSRRKRFCSATMLPTTHPGPTPGSRLPAIFIFYFFYFYYLRGNAEPMSPHCETLSGADLHRVAFVTVFGIVLSIYDLFGVRRGQCACKYPHPIMPAVFVRLLPSLRGVDEGRGVGWRGGRGGCGRGCMFFLFFFQSFIYTRTHARTSVHPSVPPETHLDSRKKKKLYLHLHKNN